MYKYGKKYINFINNYILYYNIWMNALNTNVNLYKPSQMEDV